MALIDGLSKGLLFGALLGFVAGCGGKDDTDTGGDTEDTEDTDTEPPPPSYFEPYLFVVGGGFGYDATTDQAVPYFIPGETDASTPWMSIEIYNEDFSEGCGILFSYNGNIDGADWAGEAGAHFGFTMPADATVDSNCENWDPDVWGEDPSAMFTQFSWGLGVSDLSSDVETAVKTNVNDGGGDWDADFAPYVIGGGQYWDALVGSDDYPGGFAAFAYTWSVAVDDSMTLVFDDANGNGTQEEDEDLTLNLASAAHPTTGYYRVMGAYGFYTDILLQ